MFPVPWQPLQPIAAALQAMVRYAGVAWPEEWQYVAEQLPPVYGSVEANVPRAAIETFFTPFTWSAKFVTGELPDETTVLWQSAQT